MKKHFSLVMPLMGLLLLFLVPLTTSAALVNCDGKDVPCTWQQLQQVFTGIITFIIDEIAVPLAVIAIIIGGIMMMISAGNPNLASKGKTVFWSAIIGVLLALATRVIINTILTSLGSPLRI